MCFLKEKKKKRKVEVEVEVGLVWFGLEGNTIGQCPRCRGAGAAKNVKHTFSF